MTDRGWARELGVPPSTPLDQALVTRILDYLEARVRAQSPLPFDPTGISRLVYEQKIRDWRAATENALRGWIGQPVGSLPPNPQDFGAGIRQPDDPGSFLFGTGGGSLVGDVLGGVADIVGKGLLLVAIGAVILMGAWLLFREPAVVIQQLRRVGRDAAST